MKHSQAEEVQKIRILHLEDVSFDAELVARALGKEKINSEILVVTNKAAFVNALKNFSFDVILSDHSLASFDSHEALKMVKDAGITVPFILVTATMNDEFAAKVMKDGAYDYVIKDRLHRLPSAVINSIEKNILRDKQQAAEEQSVQNEKRFRALIEKSTDMLLLSTYNGEMLYGSPSITQIFGYSLEEFQNKPAVEFIHPDDIAAFIANRILVSSTPGKSLYSQQRLLHKNGNWLWCEGTDTNMLDEPGVNAIVSNFRDISGKKLLEMQREFDGNNLNALINNTTDLMWSVDKDFNLITSNQPFDEMIKALFGGVINKGSCILSAMFSPGQLARYKKYYERGFDGETFTEIEYTLSPFELWSEISYCPILKGDEVIGTACHSRNITEIKRTMHQLIKSEADLLRSESRLKEAQSISCVGNFEVNIENHLEVWSDEMYKIYGISKGELPPSKELFLSFIHPDDLNDVSAKMEECIKKLQTSVANFRFIRKDGALRYGHSEARLEFDKEQNPTRIFGIMQDITERKLAEMERSQITNDLISRNKDLEQFAYIISHNLRAPLANIIGASNVLNDPELCAEDKEVLSRGINESVVKLDDVVKDLNNILQIKSEVNETKELVYFSALADDIKNSIKSMTKLHCIDIKYDFSAINELLTLKPYLYSIFYNLISNSVKYRRPGVGSIIEIKSKKTNNKIELIFSDNGMGIDLQKKGDQVFGLYKRFHTNIEGKGMGLFMVKTQVEALGGKISIQSVENEGTEFKIELKNES